MPFFKNKGKLMKEVSTNMCKHACQTDINALCPSCNTRQELTIEGSKGRCPRCGEINIEKIRREDLT